MVATPMPSLGAIGFADVSKAPYGAVRYNGVTHVDSTTAIQSAIDTVSALGGGTVFVPSGIYLVGQLRLKSGVVLQGAGVGPSSYLLRKGSQNVSLLVLDSVDTEMVGIANLRIVGNRNNNTAGSGIDFVNTGGDFTHSSSYHWLRDLLIEEFDEAGVRLVDTLGTDASNVHVKNVSGRGWDIDTTDSTFRACTAATCGKSGWFVQNGNNKLIGCKGYTAGQAMVTDSDEGDGFLNSHAARNQYIGCESQENGRHGFSAIGTECRGTIYSACLADANALKPLGGFAGYVLDGTTGVIIDACIADNSKNTQDYSFVMANSPTGNVVELFSFSPLTGDSFIPEGVSGNTVTINGEDVAA